MARNKTTHADRYGHRNLTVKRPQIDMFRVVLKEKKKAHHGNFTSSQKKGMHLKSNTLDRNLSLGQGSKRPSKFEEVLKSIESDIKYLEKAKGEAKIKKWYNNTKKVPAPFMKLNHVINFTVHDDQGAHGVSVIKLNLSHKIVDLLKITEEDAKKLNLLPKEHRDLKVVYPNVSNEIKDDQNVSQFLDALKNYVRHEESMVVPNSNSETSVIDFQKTQTFNDSSKEPENFYEYIANKNNTSNYHKILEFLNRKKMFNDTHAKDYMINLSKEKNSQIDKSLEIREGDQKDLSNEEISKVVSKKLESVEHSELTRNKTVTKKVPYVEVVENITERPKFEKVKQDHFSDIYMMNYINLFNKMTDYVRQKTQLLNMLSQFYEKNYIGFLTDDIRQKKLVSTKIERHFLKKEIDSVENFLKSDRIIPILSNFTSQFQKRLNILRLQLDKTETANLTSAKTPNGTPNANMMNLMTINQKIFEPSAEFKAYDESVHGINDKIWKSIKFDKRDIETLKIPTDDLLDMAGNDPMFRFGWECAMKMMALYENLSNHNHTPGASSAPKLTKNDVINSYNRDVIPLLKLSVSFRNMANPFSKTGANMMFGTLHVDKYYQPDPIPSFNWKVLPLGLVNSTNQDRLLTNNIEKNHANKLGIIEPDSKMLLEMITNEIKKIANGNRTNSSKDREYIEMLELVKKLVNMRILRNELKNKNIQFPKIKGLANLEIIRNTDRPVESTENKSVMALIDIFNDLHKPKDNFRDTFLIDIKKTPKKNQKNDNSHHSIPYFFIETPLQKTETSRTRKINSKLNGKLLSLQESAYHSLKQRNKSNENKSQSLFNDTFNTFRYVYPLLRLSKSFRFAANKTGAKPPETYLRNIRNISGLITEYQHQVSKFIQKSFKMEQPNPNSERIRVALINAGFDIAKAIDDIMMKPDMNVTKTIMGAKDNKYQYPLVKLSISFQQLLESTRDKNSTERLLEMIRKLARSSKNGFSVNRYESGRNNFSERGHKVLKPVEQGRRNLTTLDFIKRVLNHKHNESNLTGKPSEFQYILKPRKTFISYSSINIPPGEDGNDDEFRDKSQEVESSVEEEQSQKDKILNKLKNEKIERVFSLIEKLLFLPETKYKLLLNSRSVLFRKLLKKKINANILRMKCYNKTIAETEDCKKINNLKSKLETSLEIYSDNSSISQDKQRMLSESVVNKNIKFHKDNTIIDSETIHSLPENYLFTKHLNIKHDSPSSLTPTKITITPKSLAALIGLHDPIANTISPLHDNKTFEQHIATPPFQTKIKSNHQDSAQKLTLPTNVEIYTSLSAPQLVKKLRSPGRIETINIQVEDLNQRSEFSLPAETKSTDLELNDLDLKAFRKWLQECEKDKLRETETCQIIRMYGERLKKLRGKNIKNGQVSLRNVTSVKYPITDLDHVQASLIESISGR